MRANLVQSNALSIPLAANSVQCVVTSPPYYGLRDYGVGDQLGLEPTLQAYIDNMCAVFDEVWRVLRDDGTVWLNIGDSYNRSAPNRSGNNGYNDGRKNRNKKYSVGGVDGMKPKDLMLVPHRLAIALQGGNGNYQREKNVISRAMYEIQREYDDEEEIPSKVQNVLNRMMKEYADMAYASRSWWVRSDIVWHKPNPMPESVTDRPTKAHEYIFLLTKNARYYYDADAVREETNKEWEIDSSWRKQRVNASGGALSGGTGNGTGIHSGRNKRSVWTITTKPYSGAHFATFPPEIPETCIKAGTSEKGQCPECGAPWERVVEKKRGVVPQYNEKTEGQPHHHSNKHTLREDGGVIETIEWRSTCDCCVLCDDDDFHKHTGKKHKPYEPVPQIVLDPFNGSGTTVQQAQALGRIGIGLDLSWEYLQLARERCGLAQMDAWMNGRKAEAANLEGLPMFNA